jgi:hypothetical protein
MSGVNGSNIDAELDAIGIVRAALSKDQAALNVLLPRDLERARKVIGALAGLAAMAAEEDARREGITAGEYLDEFVRLAVEDGWR